MQAMILCGGLGTRLREETEFRPKPMVEVGGRPILWHIMKIYASYGITDFILCLGYKANVIKEYFLNYEALRSDFTVELGRSRTVQYHGAAHSESGWKVTLAFTGDHAQTGSRIKQASKYLAQPQTFAVTYGDGVADVDLRKVLEFHKSHGNLATVTGVHPPSRFGDILTRDDRVTAFNEKPQVGQGLINGGFFFFESGFLNYLNESEDCALEHQPLADCARDGQLFVYEHQGYWQCMDTYRDMEVLDRLWAGGQAPWKVWK
jgi:glucose-1-phosphate cytidylyltransferase